MKSHLSLLIRSRVSRLDSSGLPFESLITSSIILPWKPPAALKRSTSIFAPFVAETPSWATRPVMIVGTPRRIGSLDWARRNAGNPSAEAPPSAAPAVIIRRRPAPGTRLSSVMCPLHVPVESAGIELAWRSCGPIVNGDSQTTVEPTLGLAQARVNCPAGFAQHPPQQLACGTLGQFPAELDLPRIFVRGGCPPDERLQLGDQR